VGKDVVIALNMQVNYLSVNGSSYLGPDSEVRKNNIREYLRKLDKVSTELYYTRDIRSPEDAFYSFAKTQCCVGSLDIHMLPDLPRGNALVFTSSRPSAVWMTAMLSELKKHEPEKITLVGAETNVAIMFTAADLRNRGYRVVVPESLVIARDEYVHSAAIHIMADCLGVEVTV
jgi:nicotinamidase-related amidase